MTTLSVPSHRAPVTRSRATRFLVTLLLCGVSSSVHAVRRDPNGVNVNAQGPTTVFITYGDLRNQVPAEAFWCGELVAATPDVGQKCRPDTIFGRLPLRYDLSRPSGAGSFTDIMSIPDSVARRAYESATAGQRSSFFYVRRFTSTVGGPDEYVFVTCRMAGGGARVPFAILDVRLRFDAEAPVLQVPQGGTPPRLYAEIAYNGTGRLKGRWEVVLPGDEPPALEDLLTEATLPVDRRPLQRRYTELARFNELAPPTGKLRLAGPDPRSLPTTAEGLHQVLLRIEASDDKEGDSNLALAGAGSGVVHSGAVAGFPMPSVRYFVGSIGTLTRGSGPVTLLLPAHDAALPVSAPLELSWLGVLNVAFYRLELRDGGDNVVLSAVLPPGVERYRVPPWFKDRVPAGALRWRVETLDGEGTSLATSGWRPLRWGAAATPAPTPGP